MRFTQSYVNQILEALDGENSTNKVINFQLLDALTSFRVRYAHIRYGMHFHKLVAKFEEVRNLPIAWPLKKSQEAALSVEKMVNRAGLSNPLAANYRLSDKEDLLDYIEALAEFNLDFGDKEHLLNLIDKLNYGDQQYVEHVKGAILNSDGRETYYPEVLANVKHLLISLARKNELNQSSIFN